MAPMPVNLALLAFVALGLLAGRIRRLVTRNELKLPEWRLIWVVPLAFALQWLTFEFWPAQRLWPLYWGPICLVSSQGLLLWFMWRNRDQAGFGWLGFGLGLNLCVIVTNGGLMPITPEALAALVPDVPAQDWAIGSRPGLGRNIVLSGPETRLGLLSDRFLLPLPAWTHLRVVFSLGDALIAVGGFWTCWSFSAPKEATRPKPALQRDQRAN